MYIVYMYVFTIYVYVWKYVDEYCSQCPYIYYNTKQYICGNRVGKSPLYNINIINIIIYIYVVIRLATFEII